MLAGEAVADMAPGGVTAATRDAAEKALLATMADDHRVRSQLRASAGTALGRLGDPRFNEQAWFLPAAGAGGSPEPLLGFVGGFRRATFGWEVTSLGLRIGRAGGNRRPL